MHTKSTTSEERTYIGNETVRRIGGREAENTVTTRNIERSHPKKTNHHNTKAQR